MPDIAKEGISAVIHRPVATIPHDFMTQFVLERPHAALLPLKRGLPVSLAGDHGRMEGRWCPELNSIVLETFGADQIRVQNFKDQGALVLHEDEQGQLDFTEYQRRGCFEPMTRSTLSLLLKSSGFDRLYPQIAEAVREQLVLEEPGPELAAREVNAYRDINLHELSVLTETGPPKQALEAAQRLRQSKSQMLRRLGISLLGELVNRGAATAEDLREWRDDYLYEDVREDLIFIERTIKNDPRFVSELFRNLFGGEAAAATLEDSSVRVSYFGRGCNKQIYRVIWQRPDGALRRFGISVIRDSQASLGQRGDLLLVQGDFSREQIDRSLDNWKVLCGLGSTNVIRYGASAWHDEWRPRKVITRRTVAPDLYLSVEQSFHNNVFLVARELVENAQPLNVLMGLRLSLEEELRAVEAAARSYWGVWFETADACRHGLCFTTPRAEDVVIYEPIPGQLAGKVVDMDTLIAGQGYAAVKAYFLAYEYNTRTALARAVRQERRTAGRARCRA